MGLTLYTRKEVANILSVTISCVAKWEKSGKIAPALHINGRPRYSLEEMDRVIKVMYPNKQSQAAL